MKGQWFQLICVCLTPIGLMQLHNNNRINAGKKRGVYLDDGQFRNNENIL